MKYTIDKIYPGTAFRLFFFMTLIIGGFLGLLFLIVSLFFGYVFLGILIFTVGIPLLSIVVGLCAYLDSLFYSIFAKKFGGLKIELKKDEF